MYTFFYEKLLGSFEYSMTSFDAIEAEVLIVH